MNFPQKSFKTTERLSLEVCDSLCGEKQFRKYLTPFTGLIKKKIKQIRIAIRICPYQTW